MPANQPSKREKSRALQDATTAAGIGKLGTHSFRHTYRSWLDAVGTAITVQQRLMRDSDIQTTLNIYGDVVTGQNGSSGRTRTYNPPVNSRMLCH